MTTLKPRSEQMDIGALMTVDELSSLLKVPKSTLYGWRYRGEGPPGIRIGKYVRYPVEDVNQWLSDRRRCLES